MDLGRLIAAPRASQAPGYAQATGHGLAVRVDEYGLKQGDGEKPLILGIHVIPGIAARVGEFPGALRDEPGNQGVGNQALATAVGGKLLSQPGQVLLSGRPYSSMAPPVRRRCRRKVYDGSAARRVR